MKIHSTQQRQLIGASIFAGLAVAAGSMSLIVKRIPSLKNLSVPAFGSLSRILVGAATGCLAVSVAVGTYALVKLGQKPSTGNRQSKADRSARQSSDSASAQSTKQSDPISKEASGGQGTSSKGSDGASGDKGMSGSAEMGDRSVSDASTQPPSGSTSREASESTAIREEGAPGSSNPTPWQVWQGLDESVTSKLDTTSAAGAPKESWDSGYWACAALNIDCVELLEAVINNGHKMNGPMGGGERMGRSRPVLHAAVQENAVNCAKWLAERGAKGQVTLTGRTYDVSATPLMPKMYEALEDLYPTVRPFRRSTRKTAS